MFKSYRSAFCALVLPVLCVLTLDAQSPSYFDFYPSTVMSLGVGIDPNDLSSPKLPCVKYETHDLDAGALGTALSLSMVSSDQSLKQTLGIDTSIDVNYLAFKGSATFNLDESSLQDNTALTVVLQARTEFSRLGLQNIALLKEYQDLLTNGLKDEFVSKCGSKLVVTQRRGSMIAAIISVTSIDQQTRNAIKASVGVGGGVGPVTGSAKAQFQQELESAIKEHRVSVQIVSTGGDGFGATSDLVKASLSGPVSGSLDGIASSLSSFLKNFTKDNSAPLGYYVAPMPGLSSYPDLWSDEKQRKLAAMVHDYRQFTQIADEIRNISDKSDPRAQLIDDGSISNLRNALPAIEKYVQTIASLHPQCKTDASPTLDKCNLPSPPAVPVDLPAPVLPTIGSFRIATDTLWSSLQSYAVLSSPATGKLRARVDAQLGLIPGSTKAAYKLFMIKNPYLTNAYLRVYPTGDIAKHIKEPYNNLHAWPKGQMPRQPDDDLLKGDEYALLIEADPIDALRIPLVLDAEMEAYGSAASQVTQINDGAGDVRLDVNDLFGRTDEFALYSFTWHFDPSTKNIKVHVSTVSGEPDKDISITLPSKLPWEK